MTFTIDGEEAMRRLGARIAGVLSARPGPHVLELVGDIGAGKTTLVKGLARSLGITEDVASPSFTISRVYDIDGGRRGSEGKMTRLYHYDFYRLTDAGILRAELAEVTADPDAITVIEWAQIVEDVLPESHVRVAIRATGEWRREVIVYGLDEMNSEGTA